jgi:hypothetical protein
VADVPAALAALCVWCISLALAVLRDHSEFRLLPRWSSGLGFLTAFLFMPASATIFFKSGGFAYNGLLGMFLPLVMFMVWLEGITIPMTSSLKRELRLQLAMPVNRSVGPEPDHAGRCSYINLE